MLSGRAQYDDENNMSQGTWSPMLSGRAHENDDDKLMDNLPIWQTVSSQ
jgi:hypothetical protein